MATVRAFVASQPPLMTAALANSGTGYPGRREG